MYMYMSRVCDRDSARREAPRHKPPGSGVVHERSARAGIRPVARGSGDPLVCGRRAQQLTFIRTALFSGVHSIEVREGVRLECEMPCDFWVATHDEVVMRIARCVGYCT